MTLSTVFNELKKLMQPYEKYLVCKENDINNYYLDTSYIMKNKKPLYFGSVQLKKNYVSYHLMPVYVEPQLLVNISDELEKRMHGKSCFNFKRIEDIPAEELAALTKSGFNYYQSKGYI